MTVPTFQLRIEVHLPLHLGWSGKDPRAWREVTLPFAPFIGLTLALGDGEIILGVENTSQEQLVWDGAQFVFYTTDTALRENVDEGVRREHLGSYVDDGWTVEWGSLEAGGH